MAELWRLSCLLRQPLSSDWHASGVCLRALQLSVTVPLMATNQLLRPIRWTLLILIACSSFLSALPQSLTAAPRSVGKSLPKGLRFVTGPVNGVLYEHGGKTLAIYGDPSGRQRFADMVLLTEARRDATWAARELARGGTFVVAPAAEAELLTNPEKFWTELREKRFHDYNQQTTKLPFEPLRVSQTVKGGDTITWAGLPIRVIGTPGYTRGAVSYVMDLAGTKVAFTGDLLRDDGKLQDLFSLQDAIPSARIGGYHGWAGRLGDLMRSLELIAAEKPDLIVPLRGPVIRDPSATIARLQTRIKAVYSNYLSIDALRWYFKDEHILAKAQRVLGPEAKVDWMPMAETLALPDSLVPISNSRVILAADGAGFLVDCGSKGIIEALRKLRSEGKLASLEHVFVTHYHDDHTDALPALVAEFGTKVHACGSLVDVLERPGDYRLPCLTKNPVTVTSKHHHRDTWRWKEYQLTIFDYPGQTLYHNALLVQRDGGGSAFFAGDSFTPSGIDDYCLQNRNFLHEGQGYFRCLEQLQHLPSGCLILNQHVDPAFRFSTAQLERMRDALRNRMPLLQELMPFDDPNYGLDESWAVLHPYWLTVRSGDSAHLALRITNHSPGARSFKALLRCPDGFRVSAARAVRIGPRMDGLIDMNVQVPAQAAPGLHVITADVAGKDFKLREWVEAVVEVIN